MPIAPVIWRGEFDATLATDGQQESLSLTQLANGNILVAWESENASGPGSPPGDDIVGRIIDPLGNAVGGEFRLNAAAVSGDEEDPVVAALPNGGFVVAYASVESRTHRSLLALEEFDAAGRPVGSVALRGDTGPAAPNFGSPRIAVGEGGTVLATWLRQNPDGTISVEARTYDPVTGTLGALVTVVDGREEERPAVAALADGSFVIVSASAEAAETGLSLSTWRDGAVTGTVEFAGTATDGREDESPRVAALAGGGFVVTWEATGADNTPRTYWRAVTLDGEASGTLGPGREYGAVGLPDGGFALVHGVEADFDPVNGVMRQDATRVVSFSSNGERLGAVDVGLSGLSPTPAALGDGRITVGWQREGLSLAIVDTRDVPGPAGPGGWQVGTVGADTFTADARARVVAAWRGNDAVTEAATGGPARFVLDRGDDRMVVRSGLDGDRFEGGAGHDAITWAASALGRASFDLAAGTARAGGRTEVMAGFETLTGTQGADAIAGTAGANLLAGAAGADAINGRGGTDRIEGGRGADRLDGGTGHDVLVGGAGADTFAFGPGSGRDRVIDFADNVDTLRLDDALWGGRSLTAREVATLFAVDRGADMVLDFGAAELLLVGVGTRGLLFNDLLIV